MKRYMLGTRGGASPYETFLSTLYGTLALGKEKRRLKEKMENREHRQSARGIPGKFWW